MILIGLLAVIVIVYISSINWRLTIKVVLFLLVIEGALRKWVLPQASDIMYFLKDVILLGAYIKYYVFSASERKFYFKSEIIKPLILMIAGWCLFQAFNPSLGSPIVGLFGLKNYLFYIPLIWIIPNMFRSESELYNFLRSHLILTIPVGILGIAQFFSPATSPINVYAAPEGTGISTFGSMSVVRITGTFSYISGYAVYLIVCFGLLIPIILINQSWFWRLISIVEILLVTVNSFMTGSRGTVIASMLFLIGYLLVQGFTKPVNTLLSLRKFLVPVVVVIIAASIWFQPAIDAFWQRSTSSDSVSERILYGFTQPLEFIAYKELDGYGAGATHPGSIAIRKILRLPSGEFIPVGYESEMGRVILELGPIGFVLWYALRISLAIALFLVFWKLKRPLLRQLALAACLIHLIEINSHLVFHHTFSVYYWFLSSFIFLLPRLEQVENWHSKQQYQQDVEDTYLTDSPYR